MTSMTCRPWSRATSTRAPSEIPRAEEIVEEEIQRFARWLGQLEVLPTVSALREHGNALVEQVLAENAGRWESASPRDLARIEAVARAVMSRLLHEPTIRLRSLSEERGHASLELVRELFGLRDDETAEHAGQAEEQDRIRARPARRGPRPPAPPPGLMRIGTRGSALALAQAGHVAELLRARPPAVGARDPIELVTIKTSGDSADGAAPRTSPAGTPADKSRWVDTIEAALLAGEIDLAVHSAKDVPGELAEGLALLGAPARADAEDVLCGADALESLPAGARVGTGSLRRAAQLRAAREDLRVVAIGGNVDTRLRRLGEGDLDAIVLARAGLLRLDRAEEVGAVLDPARFVPPPDRACSRSRAARATPASRQRCARSPRRTPSPACAPSAPWQALWTRAATRRSAPTPCPPAVAAYTYAPGLASPTAQPG